MGNYIEKQYQVYLNEMPDDKLKSYILERVITQIIWYDNKSIEMKRKYKRMTVTAIIFNAIIPVIVLLSSYSNMIKIIVAALSSASGVINSFLINFERMTVFGTVFYRLYDRHPFIFLLY